MSLPAETSEGSRVFGHFRLVKPLGKGGMGDVHLAHDLNLDRRVALKMPKEGAHQVPEMRARFRREAQALAALDHPSICRVYECGEIDGQPYLAMEFVEGTSLAQKPKPLPAAEAAALVLRLAVALQAAHTRGVIHRDLKPSNIMMRADGSPVVIDFGLVRRADKTDSLQTQEGRVLGTPAYMPPEQVRGESDKVGPCSDIYSLGVILYELIVGRVPFVGAPGYVMHQIDREAPATPSTLRPGVPPVLEAVCLKAMAKEPKNRYASMAELAQALVAVGAGVPPPKPEPPPKGRLVGAAAVLLVAFGLPLIAATAMRKVESPAVVAEEEAVQALKAEDNPLGMRLVLLPKGTYTMGSPLGEEGHRDDEEQRPADIKKPFWIAAREVSQADWERVLGANANPSRFRDAALPVESVSHAAAVDFCERLTSWASQRGDRRRYRLPTEEEWEYACRGGHKASLPFCFERPSASASAGQAAFCGRYPYGGADECEAPEQPMPVGSFAANPFGLFDMHGNVAEWVAGAGSRRVARGGAYYYAASLCRAASRRTYEADATSEAVGFRVAADEP